jgi:hypothetical protein
MERNWLVRWEVIETEVFDWRIVGQHIGDTFVWIKPLTDDEVFEQFHFVQNKFSIYIFNTSWQNNEFINDYCTC